MWIEKLSNIKIFLFANLNLEITLKFEVQKVQIYFSHSNVHYAGGSYDKPRAGPES